MQQAQETTEKQLACLLAAWYFTLYCPKITLIVGDYDHLQFDRFPPQHFVATFRLSSHTMLKRLVAALKFGELVRCNGYVAAPDEALAIALARLAYPGRLSDLQLKLSLRWSAAKMSSIIKAIVQTLAATWGRLVHLDIRVLRDKVRLQQFSQAIRNQGAPFDNCFGFIDGTTFHIARPGGGDLYQAVFYSGHKRMHNVRWQGVITPDGQLMSFYGPIAGECHADHTKFHSPTLTRYIIHDLTHRCIQRQRSFDAVKAGKCPQ
jgi:hypothetical protein